MYHRYSRAERIADATVHAAGVACGVAACIALSVVAPADADPRRIAGLALYAAGLLSMLAFSALYNLTRDEVRKGAFRRLDHAAIFVMIAGTYTPFALVAMGGRAGLGLLAFVWLAAAAGVAVKLLYPRRLERLSIAAYLLLGWSIVPMLGPLSASISWAGIVLLAAGGALYSLGIVFHLWTRLAYHNAIWHLMVLAAAACHYAAIMREVAAA